MVRGDLLRRFRITFPRVCDVWRSGVAGLARCLRLSASTVTKPNVGVAPEGAQRLEHKPAVSRWRIGAPLATTANQGVKRAHQIDFSAFVFFRFSSSLHFASRVLKTGVGLVEFEYGSPHPVLAAGGTSWPDEKVLPFAQ